MLLPATKKRMVVALFCMVLFSGMIAPGLAGAKDVVVIPLLGDRSCIEDTGGTMTGTLFLDISGNDNAINATSAEGTAVVGVSSSTTTARIALFGGYFESNALYGAGVKGLSRGDNAMGLQGISEGEKGKGVYGQGKGDQGIGVMGVSSGTSATAAGVFGSSEKGKGVHGVSTDGYGVAGESENSLGVYARSTNGHGINASSAESNGIYATTTSANQWVPAIHGRNETGQGDGVYGWSQNRYGTVGVSSSSNQDHAGVWGQNNGAGHGCSFTANNTTGYGGYFNANADFNDIMLGGAIGCINSLMSNLTSMLVLRANGDVRVVLDHDGGGDNKFGVYSNGSEVFNIDETGTATTKVLVITGGADLSEGFDIAPAKDLEVAPGMVVSIDPDAPGRLQVSTSAYDRKVAGIVSGAGDVKPGMIMGQAQSIGDGEHPVALTGRVYCKADAGYGSIRPGDLLTTSPTPGHAMRVADHDRARGAVLGKAMTGLDAGEGLVLVLVSLQ